MMEQRDMDIVQAGIDGELGPEDQGRLERLLTESEEARALHKELASLQRLLGRVESVEPPDDLHGRILQQITLPEPRKSLFSLNFSDLPGLFRYGLAATAAVVLTVFVYREGNELDPSTDYAEMVGTIARGGPVAGGQVIDRVAFAETGASGEVRLLERDGVYALEFELDSEIPLQFDVDFTGNGLAFDAFARQDQELEAISWSGDTLSARARGEQRFVILMRRTEADAVPGSNIGLVVSRQGETIQSGSLKPGW